MSADTLPQIVRGHDRPIRNGLLRALSVADRALLGPLEHVLLPLRAPLETVGGRIHHVHFIEDGVASIVASDGTEAAVEIGVVGREGMTGIGLVYGDDQATFAAYMQVTGSALRIPALALTDALDASPGLSRLMLRYARAFAIQTAATAFANGHEILEARLARWLLMIADRTGVTFGITHEFIAIMLAVRRSGVTLAIQALEGKRLITAQRGLITIRDRPGLVAAASGIYGLPEREYSRLIG